MDDYSLFNAADGCLAEYIGDDLFDESLMLNILFQHRILLHEAHFFNSTLLIRHIKRAIGQTSLFEAAASRGLVVPAFRDREVRTLEEAYQRMARVYGADYVVLSPEMSPILDRVIGAMELGRASTEPFYWPTEEKGFLGDRYATVVRGLLQSDEPPSYSRHDPDREEWIRRVWAASEHWRTDCVEEAAGRTRDKGAAGLHTQSATIPQSCLLI